MERIDGVEIEQYYGRQQTGTFITFARIKSFNLLTQRIFRSLKFL